MSDQQLNPFLQHRKILNQHYGTAEKLRLLALHLYNDSYCCNISSIMRGSDEFHRTIALDMMNWYAIHGENCPHFMKVCHDLAAS